MNEGKIPRTERGKARRVGRFDLHGARPTLGSQEGSLRERNKRRKEVGRSSWALLGCGARVV